MDAQAIEQLRDEAAAEAAQVENAPAAAGQVAEAAPVADPVEEAKAIFAMAVGLASPLLPYLPAIYTEEKLSMLAAAYVPVAQKYGWDVGGWLGNYSAEIALAAVAAPLAIQTAKAHREHVAALAPKPAAEAQKPGQLTAEPAPSAAVVPMVDNGGVLAAA